MTAQNTNSLYPRREQIGETRPAVIRRHLSAATLQGIIFLFVMAGNVAAGEAHEAFFAEPTSGRKVTHYLIDLPVRLDQRETFNIPDDCDKVMRAINGGVTYKGNIIDRRLWKKTESDCRYHGFLNRHPQHVIEDHVSGYDFRNARLVDLPLDQRCAASGPHSDPANCNPASVDRFGMLRHFPIATPVDETRDRADCIPCAFRNGRFRGYAFLGQNGVRCKIDANAPGVRLIAVDFADINGDRVLDAVLRFIAIGPGNNRAPLVLPLTRFEDSAPFTVPSPWVPAENR